MNRFTAHLADSQHPWIGLTSFTEGDREFFAGRGDDVEQLLRLVQRDTLTLLYSISGLGKTSLLQAGLFPRLREENYLPVPIRLDYLESAGHLTTQVFDAIATSAAGAQVDVPQPQETLWEYFHRAENHFWSPRNDLVTPLLAFDQFEEFFTLGRETADRIRRGMEFITELADLVENRPPAALRDDPAGTKQFTFKPVPLVVLLSMREDYLGDLDYIRSRFRALAQNRLRLRPMGQQQASQVIALGGSLLAPGAADRILKYVAGSGTNGDGSEITVAPALLSLVLRELNERRLRGGPAAKITADLLDIEQEKILDDFYLQTVKDFSAGVRTFVEDKLITASGHRNSCALDDALTEPDVTQAALDKLVDRRLLAYEDRHRTRRVEVTHDVLLPVIKESRDIRRTNEVRAEADRLRVRQAAQRRKKRIKAAVAVLALGMIATGLGYYFAFIHTYQAYYREFAKKNGFPVGIGQISESEARRLPASFRLIHRGIAWDGSKLRWKPAFRVEAVNGYLEATTSHGVGTYFWHGELESEGAEDGKAHDSWNPELESKRAEEAEARKKAEQLGLKMICQWEFVSTGNGEILYERGLDRDGNMKYVLTYSSRESDPVKKTRLARFVGPDGFPQFQRGSDAEYVMIHYDNEGWEDRIMYRDGKNQAAVGPEGAFGQSMIHNRLGQLTRVLSLDAKRSNMIDNAGNCGTETKYNENGWDVEDTSVGPDLKPMPLTDGYVIAKEQYDGYGRLRRQTFHGIEGEPVLKKKSYHGWEAQYDAHGNPIAITYIGLDGKPTLLAEGYATAKPTYDARGNEIRRSYYGVNGEAVLLKDGYHASEAQYDERGNPTATSYIGLDGKPTMLAEGYAMMRSSYDAYGKETRRSYYGVNGEAVLHKKGYHAWEAQYEHGNPIAITYIGLDGKPTSSAEGFAMLRMTYDARGRETRRSCYGVNEEAVLFKDGYHAWEAQYDERGKPIAITYIGLDGKPTSSAEGFAIMRSTYDVRGKETRRSFHGVNAVLFKDGYHASEMQYDERGNPIAITYIGLDGKKPTLCADGYATVKLTYDTRGNMTGQSLHGVNGEPVLFKDGYHGWEAQYDERGHQIAMTYLGLDGKPTLLGDGFATKKWTYDARDLVTRESYHGINGKPVLYKDGYHASEAQYDERGKPIAITYIGLDGKPTSSAEGFAMLRSTYDARGRETRRSCYDVNGNPVLHKDGNHGWEVHYDESGKPITVTYLGLDGKPILLGDGFATKKSTYDTLGNLTRQSYHNVNGNPVLHKKGFHGWEMRYDDRSNPIAMTYFGLNGTPKLLDGYATVKSTYDARGTLTRQSYHDANGQPVLDKHGSHGWEAQYDERGKPIAVTYLGLNGKATLGPEGYATMKSTYDPRGKETRQTYLGVNGQPVVLRKEACHGWEAQYDDRGNQIVKTYFGVDGKPTLLSDGYATVKSTYDLRSKETRRSYYGVKGEPVVDKDGNHGLETQDRRAR